MFVLKDYQTEKLHKAFGHRPHRPTLCVSVCEWKADTGGQQWQANDVSHYNAGVKSWILIKKQKKKKKKRRKVEREKLQTNRDTKKEATCCLCESGIVWVCVASMINETVLNVSLTWPHTHTHARAALHRYSPSECIRISVQHKLNPTRVQATSLNLLALSWIPGPIVQFVKNTTSLLNAWRCDLAGPHRNWNPMRVKIIIFA